MSTTLAAVCPIAVVIEISGSKWLVGSKGEGLGPVRRKVLSDRDAGERYAALLGELGQVRSKFDPGGSARMVVGYEAGQEGFWLVRALLKDGFDAVVIDPVSLQVDRRARRAKTDRLDVQALVSALWRHASGEVKALRLVRVPSEEVEDAREWQREQDRLKAERRGCRDRVVKKLRTQGIWVLPGGWRKALRAGELRCFSGSPLGRQLQAALLIELDRLELAEAKLRQMEMQVRELPVQTLERIDRLAELRGIGPVSARALSTQLFWRQFKNRREVGACVGLTGTPHDSGTQIQDQGISKAGPPRLRALLVELSWLWLRLQPDSAITRWFHARTQGAGKRGRRLMIVAVARKLAIALWRYLAMGELPEGVRIKTQPA